MYSRTWHGIVPISNKEAFEKYLYETGINDAVNIMGNKGAFLKAVEQEEYSHFFLCTLWENLEAVILYAGENYTKAITYPEDRKYGLISDPIVIMQEVKNNNNPFA